MYEKEIARLQEMIDESHRIVFFGGAGVSTESNIPDFRSADGLYHQSYRYSPEEVVSHHFFEHHTDAFYEFYKEYFSPERITWYIPSSYVTSIGDADTAPNVIIASREIKNLFIL